MFAVDINHLHLGVDDIDSSRVFYEKLGFREDAWHGGAMFMVNSDGFELALAPHGRGEMPEWFHVGCKLESADAVRSLQDQLAQPRRHVRRRTGLRLVSRQRSRRLHPRDLLVAVAG